MKKHSQAPNDKGHPFTKRSKQAIGKPKMKLGKEDFESPSPVARRQETKGVNKIQKAELEHDEGPKRTVKKKMVKKAHKK